MTKEGFYGIVKSEWEKRKRGLTDVTEKPWNDRWKITADWQEICSVEIKAETEDEARNIVAEKINTGDIDIPCDGGGYDYEYELFASEVEESEV